MSDLRLPYGSSAVVQVFRPMRGAPQPRTASFLVATPITAGDVVKAIVTERTELLRGLPGFLHPGVPACLLVTIVLPDGWTECHAQLAEIPRAVQRDPDLGDAIFELLPALVDGLFEAVRARLEKEAA